MQLYTHEQRMKNYNFIRNNMPGRKIQDPNLLTDELRSAAFEFVEHYNGDFDYMLNMQRKFQDGYKFTDTDLCKILNCGNSTAKFYFKDHPEFEQKVVDTSDDPFEEIVSHYDETALEPDLPVGKSSVAEINERMNEVQRRIRNIEEGDLISSLQDEIKGYHSEEQELFEKFQAAIAEIRETRTQKENEVASLNSEILSLKGELDQLAKDKIKELELIAARQRLNKLQERLDSFRTDSVWGEFIKPFQWDDVCFMAVAYMEGKKGVLNANDMGLGKTFESVALISIMRTLFYEKHDRLPRILWLTKKSLRISTMREFKKWDPDMMAVPVDGNPKQRNFIVEIALQNNAVVVANYEATNTTDNLRNTDWDLVFMDEVHRLKGGANNNPTQIWENARDICHKAEFIIPLSGSPIQNHPKEMWAYLHLLDPVRFDNVKQFERQFCYGYDDGLAVNWDQLIKVLSDQVIRRSKREVLDDLPDKVREFRYLEMGSEQRAVYDEMRDNFFVWLDDQKEKSLTATAIIAQLTRLRQISVSPKSVAYEDPITGEKHHIQCEESVKIDEAMEIIEELHAAGEPVLVFTSQFNAPLEDVVKRCEAQNIRTAAITGATSHMTNYYERAFNEGEIDVLCINLRTGAEGLNLQDRCSYSIFLDLWWNPKHNEQAEDRLWREGQKNAVTIYILQCEDSVDAYIAAILEEKEKMIEGIMEDDTFRKGSDWANYLQDLI